MAMDVAMRRKRGRRTAVALGARAFAMATASAGCAALPEDCPDRLRCPPPPAVELPAPARSSSSGTGGAGGAGGEVLACVPSGDGSSVPEECGVFVRADGSDDNPGSRDAPVASITRAVMLAAKGSKRVYACAEVFAEAIIVDAPISLFGGLACDDEWVYAGSAPTTLAPPTGVPLILRRGADGARISDLSMVAPSGASPGESSIAVIADGVSAELLRCSLLAGRGADGASGGGGAGGCGGQGGGGMAGGSSFALISLEAQLTLVQVALIAGDGGRGGNGGEPQSGGDGGAGGFGGIRVNAGCPGGHGGDGGSGGAGGGAGGHSIGLAYTGVRPVISDRSIRVGVAGSGGLSAGVAGASGVAASQQGFAGAP
jgi:hypothetical protein